MKRAALTMVFLALIVAISGAADIGTFVNLGFSTDSAMFAFGVYGVESDKNVPYAELHIVDVQHNALVAKGQFELDGVEKVSVGQDGSSSLYKLIGQSQEALIKSKIDHDHTGRLVYLLLNGEDPKANLSFKDFNTGTSYLIDLSQTTTTENLKDAKVAAAFSIAVTTQTVDGKTAAYKVGKPAFFREHVSAYKIRQIFLAPNEAAMVFVVEKIAEPDAPLASSYMVETLPLR